MPTPLASGNEGLMDTCILSLFWSVPGCLRGHVLYTRPQSLIKPQAPSKDKTYTPLPSKSLGCSLPLSLALHTLSAYISSINSGLTYCWLRFDFYPAWSPGPSSLVLQEPLWVLGPGLPTSLSPLLDRQLPDSKSLIYLPLCFTHVYCGALCQCRYLENTCYVSAIG